jgi:hypothetical protein
MKESMNYANSGQKSAYTPLIVKKHFERKHASFKKKQAIS